MKWWTSKSYLPAGRRVKSSLDKILAEEIIKTSYHAFVEGVTMKNKYLSKKEVEHIAWLAHIELSEKEKTIFTEQFNEILDYFKKIDDLDTTRIEPTYNVLDLKNVYREDKKEPSLKPEEALRNAPKKEKKFLKAPRIV